MFALINGPHSPSEAAYQTRPWNGEMYAGKYDPHNLSWALHNGQFPTGWGGCDSLHPMRGIPGDEKHNSKHVYSNLSPIEFNTLNGSSTGPLLARQVCLEIRKGLLSSGKPEGCKTMHVLWPQTGLCKQPLPLAAKSQSGQFLALAARGRGCFRSLVRSHKRVPIWHPSGLPRLLLTSHLVRSHCNVVSCSL